MDEKKEQSEPMLPKPANSQSYRTDRGPSILTRLLRTFIAAFISTILLCMTMMALSPVIDDSIPGLSAMKDSLPPCLRGPSLQSAPKPKADGKVTLEASIMSKCPDAKDCLRDLIVPTMANVSDIVDFQLSYIGKIQGSGDDNVKCMHGPGECLGNILELCAADVYPDPKIYLGFTMCLTDNYTMIPQQGFVKDCALEHGVDFEKLNDCVSQDEGQYGADLLRASVKRNNDADVNKSCTVQLNDEVRCIRDGGKWKSCDGGSTPEELIEDIRKLAGESS